MKPTNIQYFFHAIVLCWSFPTNTKWESARSHCTDYTHYSLYTNDLNKHFIILWGYINWFIRIGFKHTSLALFGMLCIILRHASLNRILYKTVALEGKLTMTHSSLQTRWNPIRLYTKGAYYGGAHIAGVACNYFGATTFCRTQTSRCNTLKKY